MSNIIKKIFRDDSFTPSLFVIDWMLHDRCTYDCSYCPPSNKKGVDSWLDLNKIDEFCNEVEIHANNTMPGCNIKVLFTGGEPTVWKDFGKLVEKLSNRGWILQISSNGSRTVNWWKEHAKYFDRVFLSYHTEHTNDEEFLEKVTECSDLTDITVNIMMNPEPEMFDKAIRFERLLASAPRKFDYDFHKIQHNFGLTNINVPPYSGEQLMAMKSLKPGCNLSVTRQDNYFVEYSNGSIQKLSGVDLIKSNNINFRGYDCSVGLESIFVDAKGNVVRGTCRVGGTFGHINDPKNINWPKDSIVCPVFSCTCMTDLLNTKIKEIDIKLK